MKHLRTLLTVFAFLLGNLLLNAGESATSMANRPESPEELAELQTEWMENSLDLAGDQLEAIRKINEKYAPEIYETLQSGERKLKRLKKMKQIQEQKSEEFKFVLTEDQYNNFLEQRKAMKEKMREWAKSHQKE